jgi:uncharacterized protein (TIGR01777 family)
MSALITGATGLVGRALVRQLEAPHVLSRAPSGARAALGERVRAWGWQPESERPPHEAFAGVDTVFHLAGESVAEGRWTASKKARIRSSRVLGTQHLVDVFGALPSPPRVLVCASAIGFYGARGDLELDETKPAGQGFLAEVCQAWEAAALVARNFGTRVVLARVGLVLAPEGGALARLLPPFRMGVGGKLGDGQQWMSWIHLSDVVRLLIHAAQMESLRGPLNVVGPNPVRNEEFTRTLARVLSRPAFLSVPRAALSLLFGELGEVLLDSQRVIPRVARESQFVFNYPELAAALQSCLNQSPQE